MYIIKKEQINLFEGSTLMSLGKLNSFRQKFGYLKKNLTRNFTATKSLWSSFVD